MADLTPEYDPACLVTFAYISLTYSNPVTL